MRKLTMLLLAMTLGLCLASRSHAVLLFHSTLEEGQEVAPLTSLPGAGGVATLSLNNAQDRLEISVTLFGLDLDGLQTPGTTDDDVARFHIHRGIVGVNGPIIFGFIDPDNDTNGDLTIDPVAGTVFSAWDLTEGNGTTLAAELANLLAGGLYLNVHTPLNPGGQIRGQINPVPEPGTWLLLGTGLFGLLGYGWRQRSKVA